MGAAWERQSSASRELWESSCLSPGIRQLESKVAEWWRWGGWWPLWKVLSILRGNGYPIAERKKWKYILKGTFKMFNADETWPWSFRMGASHALELDPRCLCWDRHSPPWLYHGEVWESGRRLGSQGCEELLGVSRQWLPTNCKEKISIGWHFFTSTYRLIFSPVKFLFYECEFMMLQKNSLLSFIFT